MVPWAGREISMSYAPRRSSRANTVVNGSFIFTVGLFSSLASQSDQRH
jgi:hypothetical protein